MIKKYAFIIAFITLFLVHANKKFEMMGTKLDQDTQLTTSSGCTFMAEKGWIVSYPSGAVVLEDSDHDVIAVLCENTEETAEKAVRAAWQSVRKDAFPPIENTIELVPSGGFDEIVDLSMVCTAGRESTARASRFDNRWHILLIEGSGAALDRRRAGIGLISSSYKVPGLSKESFAGRKATVLTKTRIQEFMNFVEEVRVAYKIPGLALGIVQNGKLIYEQGLGVRDLSTQEKVTPNTLFMVGSITKPLTTLMMACLADERRFTWDTPITEIMPDFALADEATTKQLRVRHMVSASTGIPRQDLAMCFNFDQATPELCLREMRNMKPTTGFGETFQYSNAMVAAGGYIAAHAVYPQGGLGATYDAVMLSRVFDPLGMHASTFDFARVQQNAHAIPHGMSLYGEYVPCPIDNEKWVESLRPAAGLWSTVHDIAQYLLVELDKGSSPQGTRIVSEQNLLKRRETQIRVSKNSSYGLGLWMIDYSGVSYVGHDGLTFGFTSSMFFLPEHKVGLVVLTNAGRGLGFISTEEGSAVGAISTIERKFMEMLFDGQALAQKMLKNGLEQSKKIIEKDLKNITLKPERSWLMRFIGTYAHPFLGQIVIRATPDGAECDARVWKSALGRKGECDGASKLVLTGSPMAGLEIWFRECEESMQLEIYYGQHTYILKRI